MTTTDTFSTAIGGGGAAALGETLAMLKTGALGALDTQLSALYLTQGAPLAASSFARQAGPAPAMGLLGGVQSYANAVTTGTDGRTYVVIDATAKDGDGAALLASLNALGLQQGSSFGKLASGLIPVEQLGALAALDNLGGARQSAAAVSVGKVTSQADVAHNADDARATYGVDGSGLKIGVLSDSFDTSGSLGIDGLPDTTATNIASGDLPVQTKIIEDLAGGSDEGRGMAQLIHDIAPGAAISFATAFTGQAGFANNILRLAADGAKVIVDDVIYFFEPAFQDGVIAQAVDQVTAQGVSYFSSAGNNGFEGYQSRFYDGGYDERFQGRMMEFAPGETALSFVASGFSDIFVLQWDQPAASAGGAGSASDVDLFVTDASGDVVYTLSAANNLGDDPAEGLSFQGTAGQTYYLRVSLYDGPAPTDLKLMALGNGSGVDLGTTARNTNNGTTYGHAAAVGANAVGAAYYLETPEFGTSPALLEDFSSGGPVTIRFDRAGNRLATPEIRATPTFTAVDGTNTTFFGNDTRGDADSFPNFFGTSAAAPNAAAIALLMLQANSALTNGDIRNLLRSASLDMDNPSTPGFDVGYDTGSGSGLVLADLAVRYAATLVIDNAGATQLYGTSLGDRIIAGTGDNLIRPGAGADFVDGGAGNDTVSYDDASSAVLVSLATNTGRGGAAGDRYVNVENLTGSAFADTLTGSAGANVLDGGAGDDVLNGGAGNDRLIGGAGTDIADYADASAGVTVSLLATGAQATGGAGSDTLSGIESIIGSAFADRLTGDANANVLRGGGGADVLAGNDGADTLYGDAGADTLNGGNGADTLYGGADADAISGGAGNDLIVGGAGADYMEGGAGGDTFTFLGAGDLARRGAPRLDTIADFTGAGAAGGDNLIFYGMGQGGSLVFSGYSQVYSASGVTSDLTKQYYDVRDASGTYQGSIFVLMGDGATSQLVSGVDYFFGA